jgi:hypothetical protein
MKGKKKKPKTKDALKHKANIDVRLRFFMVPLYLFGTTLTCHLVTALCGFHVTFNMLRLLDDIPDIKKAVVSR